MSPVRLLRTPAPYFGESFLGYLLRLTEENAYDSLRWIINIVGLEVNLTKGWSLETLSTGPKIALLREITGLNEAELESLRKTLVPGCLLRWTAPKVCSICLREKSWCRKAWEVLPFTACPLHQAILIDSCPHCHQPLSWRRKNVSVCSCGYDWRLISPPVIEGDGELTAGRRMISIWGENASGYFPFEDATDSPLTPELSTAYPDALCALSDAWLFLRNEARLQATTENWLCHRAVTSVTSALDNWPEGFFRFCDKFDTTTLQKLWRRWSDYRGSRLSETQGWHMVRVALREYHEGRQNGGRLTWENFLRIEEVANDLGIWLGQVSDLGQYGWLTADSGPGIDGLFETKFSRKTLDLFIDRISFLVTPAHDAGVYNVIPFGHVADHLWLHGLSFGSFMQAMDSGFPQPVIEREGLPGRLSRFWFRIDEINQYFDSQIDPEKRPTAIHHVVPSVSKVAEWLERKQEEFDKRFYYGYPQPPQARDQRAGFANIYTADQLRSLMRLQCVRTRKKKFQVKCTQ